MRVQRKLVSKLKATRDEAEKKIHQGLTQPVRSIDQIPGMEDFL